MIVSNCMPPLVVPSGKQAVFHKMAAQFGMRICIRHIANPKDHEVFHDLQRSTGTN
jgi:hypothetical protein